MIDVDAIADFDSVTGAPVFDNRSTACRWLEALDEGPMPEFNVVGPPEEQNG